MRNSRGWLVENYLEGGAHEFQEGTTVFTLRN
jgi:hypothetical protein